MSSVCFLYYKCGFIFLNLGIYPISEGQANAVHNTNRFQANLICVLDHFSWLYTERIPGCWRLNIFPMLEHWGLISNHSKQGTRCWHSDRYGLGKTVGNVKCMVRGWLVDGIVVCMAFCFVLFCMCSLFSFSLWQKQFSTNFLATSQENRRKLYPVLPLGSNEIHSPWASFSLDFQIAKPV